MEAEIFVDTEQRKRQLVQACHDGDVSQVRRLIRDPRNKLDINASTKCRFQGTPLTAAAGSGQVEIVKILLSLRKDLDPNVKDGFGRSAYYYALKANHTDVLKHLNKDSRHRVSTVTEAMMECPLESVEPVQLPMPVPAKPADNTTGFGQIFSHIKSTVPTSFFFGDKSADSDVVEQEIHEVIFPESASEEEMADYLAIEFTLEPQWRSGHRKSDDMKK